MNGVNKAMACLGYQIQIYQDSDESWIAEVPDLEGCVSDGDSPEEALQNVKDAINAWINTAKKNGWSVPLPTKIENSYSGKFTLRVAKSMHSKLAKRAVRENVSLNQLVSMLIVYGLGALESKGELSTLLGNTCLCYNSGHDDKMVVSENNINHVPDPPALR